MSQGEMIQVSMADYQKLEKRVERLEEIVGVQQPIDTQAVAKQNVDIPALIKEMQEKYAGTTSLTQALLADRRAEPEQMADYQALARRVERLEKIVSEQLPKSVTAEVEASPVTPTKTKDIRALIKELQNEYSQYPSLTQALLADRRAELEREEADLRARQLRHTRAHSKRTRKGNHSRAGRKSRSK
ncbi:MAG: hypothetical protein HY741_01170 [Chloroflexi bacterium]|nr:hypothetical protein [Chloroflexota bacterium]